MGFSIPQILKQNNLIFLGALILYAITALNSHGYFHGDEHFQIIEFAHNKLTGLPTEWLAWEYQIAIRPAVQVNLAYLLLGFMRWVGFENPIYQLMVIRLLSALLVLLSIRFFIKHTKNHFQSKHHLAYEAISYFVWFFPLLAARFSSETLAASFFLFTIGYYFKTETKVNWIQLGLLMGISFLFRFQMAFAFLGFIFWLVQVKKESIKTFIRLGIGLVFALVFGVINDRLFYGQFEFTPWNYFESALVKGVDFDFGSEPWHFFISASVTYLTIPFAALVFAAFLVLLYQNPKSWILFTLIPFLFLHTYFSHKEIRFLFPIAFLLPYLLFAGLEQLPHWRYLRSKRFYFSFLFLFIGLNLMGIFINTQKAAGNAQVEIIRYLNRQYPLEETTLYHTNWANPYDPWQGLHAHFYKPVQYDFVRLNNSCELSQQQFDPAKTNLFLLRQFDLERDPCINQLDSLGFKFQHQSMSEFIKQVAEHYAGLNSDGNLILYRLETK